MIDLLKLSRGIHVTRLSVNHVKHIRHLAIRL